MRMNIARSGAGARDSYLRLERWEYGNPEEVAARRQAQSCHGCRHEEKIQIGTQSTKYCGKARKHGKRCAFYQLEEI
jgi:ribosomal protein S13